MTDETPENTPNVILTLILGTTAERTITQRQMVCDEGK